ncbi:MAG: hypothetical protein ABI175_10095, partial [Polyangiales bacterium]
GGSHRDEVQQVLLPRAERRDARAALLAELDRAAQVGTLAALRAFVAAHPDHGLTPELARATHAVYVAALERYRPLAPDAEALAFVTRLLLFSEDHGPTVLVRFVRAPSPSLLPADQAVERSAKFAGTASYPSRYVDDAHASAAETALLSSVRARLAAVFPAELVALEVATPDDDARVERLPVLTIEHHVEWAGDTVTISAPPGVFVTPQLEIAARFVVPDDGMVGALTTLDATIPGVLPETSDLARADGAPAPEDAIYRAMQEDAFTRFGATLLAQLFRN